ncbi:MAG: hypothetical protein ACRDT8_04725 [Micromonosporaceae bacterium]
METTAQARATADLLDEAVAQIDGSLRLPDIETLAGWLAERLLQLNPHTGRDLLTAVAEADRESRRTGEGVVLAQAASGHVMVVRFFPEGQPTPIHGHGGWGAVAVLAGRGRYETWQPVSDGLAELTAARELGPGDTLAWPNPPDDVHRQVGVVGGTTEVTIFARHPFFTWAPQFQPASVAAGADVQPNA